MPPARCSPLWSEDIYYVSYKILLKLVCFHFLPLTCSKDEELKSLLVKYDKEREASFFFLKFALKFSQIEEKHKGTNNLENSLSLNFVRSNLIVRKPSFSDIDEKHEKRHLIYPRLSPRSGDF